jgi:hypothetical protein
VLGDEVCGVGSRADAFPVGGYGDTVVVDCAGGDEPVSDRGVERGGVLAGVDHHRGGDAAKSRCRDACGERITPPPRWRAR